eukprot:gene17633-36186_t
MSSIASSSSRLTIFGQGSTIKNLSGENNNCQSRFLSISNLNRPTGYLSFHFHNVSIHGFGSSTIDGGALYLQGLNDVIINAVTFIHNIGSCGGALYMSNCSLIIIDNFIFIDNYSTDYGGGFYLNHRNIAQIDDGGFYLSESNSDLSFTNCIVSHNSAGSTGGGVHVNIHNQDLKINAILFTSNAAYGGNGGAIYASENNSLSFTSCNMTLNAAIS